MATAIYINTDLKDLTANAVASVNRPTQLVRLPQIIEGETVAANLYFVNSNGAYDSRSGSGSVAVAVSISARGQAATSGTWTLSDGSDTTTALQYNASAEAVQTALNALNSNAGAFSTKVAVTKLANGSYRVIFATAGAKSNLTGTSVDLAPESEVTAGTSVTGTGSIKAQQVIEISQQPAIYTDTTSTITNGFSLNLSANNARVQQLIASGGNAFFEVKVDQDVICQVPVSVLAAVAAPNSLPASDLPEGASISYVNAQLALKANVNAPNFTGLQEHSNNSHAIAAGLSAGDVYRHGDSLKIVH